VSGMARVLAILDVFSRERSSWSPEEINQALGYSRPTGYRYVKELVGAGLLQKTSAGRYSLGPRIIELDYEIRQSDPILIASTNIMAELAAQTSSRPCSRQCMDAG
jgi:DNA-binding IclR family transcriptional regulator